MIRAQILTPWIGDGITAPYRPALADVHPVESWSDVTGQDVEQLVPTVNAYVIEVICSEAQLAAIEADPNYCVITSEVIDEAA